MQTVLASADKCRNRIPSLLLNTVEMQAAQLGQKKVTMRSVINKAIK